MQSPCNYGIITEIMQHMIVSLISFLTNWMFLLFYNNNCWYYYYYYCYY